MTHRKRNGKPNKLTISGPVWKESCTQEADVRKETVKSEHARCGPGNSVYKKRRSTHDKLARGRW